MKTKSDFVAITELLNMLRSENKTKIFSVKELKEALHGIVPVNDLARTWLVRSNIIVRVGYGKYSFPKEPIHWACVKRFYEQARDSKNRSNKAHREHDVASIPQTIQPVYDEQKAVAFLKDRGYVILKMM